VSRKKKKRMHHGSIAVHRGKRKKKASLSGPGGKEESVRRSTLAGKGRETFGHLSVRKRGKERDAPFAGLGGRAPDWQRKR